MDDAESNPNRQAGMPPGGRRLFVVFFATFFVAVCCMMLYGHGRYLGRRYVSWYAAAWITSGLLAALASASPPIVGRILLTESELFQGRLTRGERGLVWAVALAVCGIQAVAVWMTFQG